MSASTPPPDTRHALPVGQRLGEFEIRSVLGVGGFGIVYHAFDHALERDVAIKEYMPSSLAARSATLHVSLLSQGHAETFALGLKSFVNEARLLARFDHPSLVKVHRFWDAHGTAYMVMPLYRGRTLKALRQASGEAPDEAWLRRLLEPLLGALEVLHAEGVFHRDIAPDNILVGDDGRPVLLDFGAARRVIGDRSQTLTAILKPSYAPVEQYAEADGLRQGPWTDLYALGATLAYTITGRAPQPATARALGTDAHALAGAAPTVSARFAQIVDWMMAVRPEHRPQNVAALRAVLDGEGPVPEVPLPAPPAPSPAAWQPTVIEGDAAPKTDAVPRERRRGGARWAVAAGLALVVAGVAGAAWLREAAPQESARSSTAAPLTTALPSAPVPVPPIDQAPAAIATATPVIVAASATPTVATRREDALPATPPRLKKVAARPAPAIDDASSAAEPPPSPPVVTPTDTATALSPPSAAADSVRPRDLCQGRLLVALHRCLKRVCEDPVHTNHRDCRRMRQVEASTLPRER